MRRLWIGLGFLVVILTVALVLSLSFARIHEPLSQGLRQAEELSREGDWPQARQTLEQCRGQWQKMRNFVAAVADHEPLEELETCLEELRVLGELEESVEFGALCARAASLADAMGNSQAVTWWNLL